MEIAIINMPRVNIRCTNHPGNAHDLDKLRNANRKGFTAIQKAVNVDHRWNFQAVGLRLSP